ncbi:PRA1 family protein D [Senna tora]|uniref:PRA1 family protein n=1 Tax=Senna tora TaxID=362788 RepID=A0A834W2K4_9FABA|nr:PRA1 family protein D [Senna tora]
MSTTTELFSTFKETSQSVMSSRRPWRQLLDFSALSFPSSISDATTRMTQNASHFFSNYTLILLVILFLSLVYHPFSMVVFLVVFAGWYFLYFSRDEPLSVFNWVVDERVVVVGLGVITVVALILTHVWLNVLASLAIGIVVVCLHAAFRGTEDLVMDDQESPYGPMLSGSTAGPYSSV